MQRQRSRWHVTKMTAAFDQMLAKQAAPSPIPQGDDPMTTALAPYTMHLDTLFTANLLCHICEKRPWTTTGRWHPHCLLCADCRTDEPSPDEEEN